MKTRPPESTDADLRRELARLLEAIEADLRRLSYWEAVPPAPERLASEVPFCHDTLELTQWLQWIFVPRFRALLDARGPLPAACSIAPVAELAFGELPEDTDALLALLSAFDSVIATRRLP